MELRKIETDYNLGDVTYNLKCAETLEDSRAEEALKEQCINDSVFEWCYAYIRETLLESGVDPTEIEIQGIAPIGSRTRKNLYHDNSDLDILISYKGEQNLREDDMFAILEDKEPSYYTESGQKLHIDFWTSSIEKNGDIVDVLEKLNTYLDEKEKRCGYIKEIHEKKLQLYNCTQPMLDSKISNAKELIDKCMIKTDINNKILEHWNSYIEFVEDTMTKENWQEISTYHTLSESFISTFKDELDWGRLCAWQDMSIDFLASHEAYINLDSARMNPNIDCDKLKETLYGKSSPQKNETKEYHENVDFKKIQRINTCQDKQFDRAN